MRIALIGYGKMGRAVEQAALARGHEICATIDGPDDWQEKIDTLRECDMAIEFSTPGTAVENIMKCFNLGLPVVSGTTGWHDCLEEVAHDCTERGQALFVASNFSIGMNIMFELNRRLAELMNGRMASSTADGESESGTGYSVAVSETHHVHKLDAPSGTAITLANDIKSELSTADCPCPVPITSHREGEVPGIHEVVYDSSVDTITLRHEAKSRKGLALGAVLAAEFLVGKHGYYTMKELLG